MKNVVILPHQSHYMQAPFLFPDLRFFMLLSGYGAGKTRANVFAIINDIKRLQGVKDRAGDYVRLMICGVTLSHLEKTLLIYFRQYLDISKTKYIENKKYNYFKIGTVTVLLQPMENPGEIYGLDVYKIYVEEADELTTDKLLEAVKALNERCRQTLPGERPPSLSFGSTSQGQKGLYALYNYFIKTGIGFLIVRGRTQDNPFLPKELIKTMYKIYTKEERLVFMEGMFLAIAKGRVIPGFDWARNYVEYDLDTDVRPGEVVYWAQDINCIAKGEKVHTFRGDIPIEQVIQGDLVLTRKGYKKVLSVFDNGPNWVSRCATLYSTRGHIFRTPEGDKAQWQVKQGGNIYYLPKHESFRLRIEGIAEKVVLKVKELNLMGLSTIDTQARKDLVESISSTLSIKKCFMLLFGSILTLINRNGVIYTISMVKMIIDLHLLYAYFARYIQHYTQENGLKKTLNGLIGLRKKRTKQLERGTKAKQDRNITVSNKKRIGQMGFLHAFVCVSSVIKNSLQKFLLQCPVLKNVSENASIKERKRLVEKKGVMSMLARNVERSLKVLKKLNAAQELALENIKEEKMRNVDDQNYEFNTNVYDLEVEDAHEYFVNGTLVHNTGYNRGSAWIVREGVAYCIKYYDFPDLTKAAGVVRHDFPEQEIKWLPDVTIKDSFPSMAKDLRKYKIKIIYKKKNPLVEDSCFLVSKLFYLGRMKVCKIAQDVAEACATAMRDKENKIPKGVGASSPIHALDGVRYAAIFIVANHPDFKDIRKLILEKRASLRDDEDKEELVKELDGGYSEINPKIFLK
jgi:hypothetical protein